MKPKTMVYIVGALVLWNVARGVQQELDNIGQFVSTELNPASDKNLIYTGFNNAAAWLTDDVNFNLGSKIYDWTH